MGGGPVSGVVGNLDGIRAALLSSAALLFPGALFFARAAGLRAGEIRTPPDDPNARSGKG